MRRCAVELGPGSSRRRGVTLLEVVMAGTLAASLLATAHAVLRTVHAAAESLGREADVLHHADQALRFITRRCRGAARVTAIDPVGFPFRVAVDGGELEFSHWAAEERVQFRDLRVGPDAHTVADHVTGFAAAFYEADAVTPTTDPAAARLIEITLTVDLPRDHAPARTVSGRVWVRPW